MTNKTIGVSESTYRRLTESKPYDSLSYGEFIDELLDQYESPRRGNAVEEGSA